MRSILVASTVLLTLLIAPTTPTSLDETNKEAFDREFELRVPADDPRREAIGKALRTYAGCKDHKWSCQKPCRAQIPIKGNDTVPYCVVPHPGETCFGAPIDYKYVPSRESLPFEYEVLRRFPKCWSVLAPMMCGLIYRPCGVYEFSARLISSVTKMEVWQRFGIGMCKRVHEHCEDAIKEGFFPSELIDCTRTTENVVWLKQKTNATGPLSRFVPSGNTQDLKTEWDRQTVFTEEKCDIKYNENASHHEPMQCMFPLVYTMHERIRPIIDKCFLPCRNPLISSPDKFLSFRVIRALLCIFFGSLCFAIFMFLSVRSKIFTSSHTIFSIACCLLCFSIYLAFWALGSIPYFANSSECTRTSQGVDIRSTPIDETASSWCLISAVVQHSALLCSIGFLAAAYPLSVAAATKLRRREEEKEREEAAATKERRREEEKEREEAAATKERRREEEKKREEDAPYPLINKYPPTTAATKSRQKEDEKKSDNSSGFRFLLVFSIVVVSTICGVVPVFFKMLSTDGVAGVCSFGLHSIIHHLTALVIPGLVFCFIALVVGALDVWSEKKLIHKDVEDAIEKEIIFGSKHEESKEIVVSWKDRGPHQKEDIQERTRQGSLPTVEEISREGESVRGSVEIEKDGEKDVLVLNGDDEEKEWLSEAQKRDISDAAKKEKLAEWRRSEKSAWYDSISSRYTLAALCLCMLSLLLGLAVHWSSLANDGREEYEAIMGYVTCVMSKSIVRKDLHWLAEPVHAAEMWNEGRGESDPLVRRHNLASEITIHDCHYPSTGDGRIMGLLCVFLLLPLLPIALFIWAFAAGLAGAGGMARVKERRPKAQKKPSNGDEEMTDFNTECDANSQRISSDDDDDDDVVVHRPGGASSTLSTNLSSTSRPISSVSSTSSTPSSASLLGDLPRFASTERLMTVRATSPVPSVSRSAVVVAPERRSRRSKYHVLDVMARQNERKKQERKAKKKKRVRTADMNARREGQAETGQLVAPRNTTDHDTRSVSSHSTSHSMQSGVSSSLIPPSHLGRMMMRNAEALMARSRQTTGAAGLQHQVQMVQEELLLRMLPNDEHQDQPSGSGTNQQHPQWFRNLQNVRARIEEYSFVSNAATPGMVLSGRALALGRLMILNGTQDFPINHQILQFALEHLQSFVYHLQNGLAVSPQLEMQMSEGNRLLIWLSGMNEQPDVQFLTREFNLNLQHDIVTPEALRLRTELYQNGTSETRRAEILDELLMGANRRSVLRLATGSLGHLQQPQQEQLQQGGPGRPPPVYPPMHMVDLSQTPPGAAVASSSNFSVTNSSVPSSTMTTAHEERQIRLYHETYGQPPVYDGLPSTSGGAAAAAAGPSSSSAAESAGMSYMATVMRANGRTMPPMLQSNGRAVQPVYAQQSAYFAAPISSDLDGSRNDEDPMSSETSMDSIGRRADSSVFSGDSFAVSIRDVGELQRAAPNSNAAPPRMLFPSLRPDPSLPPVPSFPGARLMDPMDRGGSSISAAPDHVQQYRQTRRGNENGLNGLQQVDGLANALREEEEEAKRKEESSSGQKRKRVPLSDNEPSCSTSRRRNDDDTPPRIGRVLVPEMDDERFDGLVAQMQARSSGGERRGVEGGLVDDDSDSGLESLGALERLELEERERRVQDEVEDRLRRVGGRLSPSMRRDNEDQPGPSNEEALRRNRMNLMNRYMNHSNPDLAMAEEEREQREVDEERERDERRRVDEARRMRLEHEREERGPNEEDVHSISSLMTADEQAELVIALREALSNRSTEGMSDDQRRFVDHLRLALDTQGGISREEIMRYRVTEQNIRNRESQQPDHQSPYSVSSVVVSRLSLAEIGARVDAIRRLSESTLYPLEVYYQLHLADVLWPLTGRDVMMGDNVYTHDEINRVLGADSPLVPAGADRGDFHQLMRKRAITAASLTGRAYGSQRGSEGPNYQPPRLPDQGVYQTFGDPSVILAAINGDLQPIRLAIDRIPMTMPDIMRLDNRSAHTLGSHLRHFRDFLDQQARVAGFELRSDTYPRDDVPPEPTGSRPNDDQPPGPQPDSDPDADPDF